MRGGYNLAAFVQGDKDVADIEKEIGLLRRGVGKSIHGSAAGRGDFGLNVIARQAYGIVARRGVFTAPRGRRARGCKCSGSWQDKNVPVLRGSACTGYMCLGETKNVAIRVPP